MPGAPSSIFCADHRLPGGGMKALRGTSVLSAVAAGRRGRVRGRGRRVPAAGTGRGPGHGRGRAGRTGRLRGGRARPPPPAALEARGPDPRGPEARASAPPAAGLAGDPLRPIRSSPPRAGAVTAARFAPSIHPTWSSAGSALPARFRRIRWAMSDPTITSRWSTAAVAAGCGSSINPAAGSPISTSIHSRPRVPVPARTVPETPSCCSMGSPIAGS